MHVYLRIYVHDNMYVIYVYMYRSKLADLPLGHYAASVITERAHRQYIYLFIYTRLSIKTLLTFGIENSYGSRRL